MKLQKFFKMMVEQEASDLFLRAHAAPRARIDGNIHRLADDQVTEQDMKELVSMLLVDDNQREFFIKNADIDFIYVEPSLGRFRINLFMQRTQPSLVARYVKSHTKRFTELNLPVELCETFCQQKRGLVLTCGAAGNGKTTAIASMIEQINEMEERHIVTLEDPIEYLFKDKKSIINQREMGIDFQNYPTALRHVTQQSPDVLFIGTIRDEATMKAALSAAEMGILVFATFHTTNAVQTLDRIINFFPPHLHGEISLQLSLLLKGVLSLRLLPFKNQQGRVPAYESMVVTPTVARLIREQNIREVQSFINEGKLYGMRSFRQTLVDLVRNDLVEEEVARQAADSKDEFNIELSGMI